MKKHQKIKISKNGRLIRKIHIFRNKSDEQTVSDTILDELRGSWNHTLVELIKSSIDKIEGEYSHTAHDQIFQLEHTVSTLNPGQAVDVSEIFLNDPEVADNLIQTYRLFINLELPANDFLGNHSRKDAIQEKTPHIVGTVRSEDWPEKPMGDHLFASIIQSEGGISELINLIHDISLDWYFCHSFLSLSAGDSPFSIEELRSIANAKLAFARLKNLKIYNHGIDSRMFGGTDHNYFSIGLSCRCDLKSQAFDHKKYSQLWLEFREFLKSNRQFWPRESVLNCKDTVILTNLITKRIKSILKKGGSLSERDIRCSILATLNKADLNFQRDFSFYLSNSRPKTKSHQDAVAKAFGYGKWRQNMWIFRPTRPEIDVFLMRNAKLLRFLL